MAFTNKFANAIRSTQSLGRNGLRFIPAFFNDRPLVTQLIMDHYLHDPHHKSVGCTVSEIAPIASFKVHSALRMPLSMIIEDSQGLAGVVMLSQTHRNRTLDRMFEVPNEPTIDKEATMHYYYLDNVYKFCRLHLWTVLHDRYEKVGVIKVIHLPKRQDPEVYRNIILHCVDKFRKSSSDLEGVACTVTDNLMLQSLEMADFKILFKCPPEIYLKDDGSSWAPKDDLDSAHVAWLSFDDVIERKTKANK